jgi:hypothetical protein
VAPNPPSSGTATSIAAVDSPNTGAPLDSNTPPGPLLPDDTSVIDVRYALSQYLVAVYPDGSIYAVARLDWTCNYWADTNDPARPGRGATNIRDPNGVRADAYSRTNANPNTRPPVYNYNMHWQ